MKKTLIVSCFLINHSIIQAQTNTFPATGNVGVGTTAPDTKLAIRGGMSIGSELGNSDPRPGITAGTLPGELRGISKNGSGLDDGFLRLSAGGGANPLTKSFVDLSGYAATTNTDRNLNIVMGTSGTERLRITSAGNVGIGTISPENVENWQKVLEVKGTNHSKSLVSTTSIISGLWSHEIGTYGAPAGGISGTYTNHPFSFITNKINRMTITGDGKVGIGAVSPAATLHIGKRESFTPGAEGSVDRIAIQPWFHTGGPWFISSRDNPAKAYLDIKYGAVRLYTMDHMGNVGIGTTHLTEKLSVNGKIRAKEIRVEADNGTNWPDYVFDSSYQLPALAEVEKFIKDHKHLPGIPSAKQVKENGIALGENQAALLKKIEEQSLYIIQQEKKMEALEKRIASLEKLITK